MDVFIYGLLLAQIIFIGFIVQVIVDSTEAKEETRKSKENMIRDFYR